MADVQKTSIDPLPRLRLGRPSSNHSASSQSQAGPSRLPDFTQLVDVNFNDLHGLNASRDDEQDDAYTPKLSQATLTPAARLRALLSRVPTRNDETPVPPLRHHSPSEIDSDFDPPEPVNATPSIVHESLKDIFSRALREPGDTPQKQKGRRRSNSYDFSELESSPRPDKVREKINGKRKSWSDEEVETLQGNSGKTRTPFKSSNKSITLDILRERFTNSESRDDPGLGGNLDNLHDRSDDTATILQNLESTPPPVATSTPQQSLRISMNSQFQYQSNLLEQDSEMQHAIGAFDSYEDISPFSASNAAQELSLGPSQTVANGSVNNRQDVKSSRKSDLNRSSSQSSSHLHLDKHRHLDEHDKTRERERDWNRPRTPASPHSPPVNQRSHSRVSSTGSQGSYIPTLYHRSSTPSLNFDRESSKGSSLGSQAEYRERIREFEKERNVEREREWNKPVPKSGRPSSSLSFHSPISKEHERSRTQSFNNLPKPPLSKSQSPDLHANPSLRRHHSLHSDRGSSPTGSVRDHLDEAVEEVVHERERNWNAPRPKWHQHPSHQKPSPSASGRFSPIPSSSSQRDYGRVRSGSETDASIGLAQSRISGKPNSRRLGSPRPSSPLRTKIITPSSQRSKLPTHVSRVDFPSSTSKLFSKTPPKVSPSSSRLKMDAPANTHAIIQNRQTLPPLDPEDLSHYRRPQQPSSPTPSVQTLPTSPPPLHASKGSPSRLGDGHSSRSYLTPDIKHHNESEDAMSSIGNSETHSPDRTPTLRTIAVGPPSPDRAQPFPAIPDNESKPTGPYDGFISTKAQPAPPSPPPLHSSILSTPPRGTSLKTPPAEFQSPSPPQGLPDLPEPPLSSEDEDVETLSPRTIHSNADPNPNWTLMKTPKPPGAWMTTPATSHRKQFSPDSGETESNGGLVTPVASLSRGSSLLTRTPAPPGAWDTTYRKSILKVRFGETQDILQSQADVPTPDIDSTLETDTEGPKVQIEDSGRPTTPEPRTPRTPTSPSRSPRSVRKSPGIRVLDAFGNEAGEDNVAESTASRTSPNKSVVRMVDAMGREVNESNPLTGTPSQRLTSGEAFSRVRKGLDGLVQDLNDMDRETSENPSDNHQHISNLEEVSRSARETRQDISKRMKLNITEVESMTQSLTGIEKTSHLRWSKLYRNVWFIGGFVVFQLFFTLIIFRLSINQAKNHFFNAYYDPFYPDVYFTRPHNLHRSILSTPYMSWLSVIHRHGLKSISQKVLQSMYATLWTTWGSDVDPGVWPPT